MKIKILILAAFGLFALHTSSAFAQQTIAVDEQGNYILNGVLQPPGTYAIAPEPISGMQCLVYPLFFQPNPGDIEVVDSDGTTGDIIRFIPNSAKLYFFSLLDGPSDGLADVPVLPPPIAALNRIILPETGPEGNDSIFWPAPPGGIGADGNNPIQYTFVSDGTVTPEPSTFILLGLGSGVVGFVAFKRRKGAA